MDAELKKSKSSAFVEILDTTLRDGEQTPGVAFTPEEKLQIAKVLILRAKVDRLEIGSARVSEGERIGVQNILAWAEKHGVLDRMEILGFIDGGKSAIIDMDRDKLYLAILGDGEFEVMPARHLWEGHYQADQRDNSDVTKLVIRFTGSADISVAITPMENGFIPDNKPIDKPFSQW